MFHEFGHASACRYGGARPGCIGCGLYLIWPSMYTEVTDVYRISRGGRIRTDLGGVYFNVVFMLVLTGCYLLTGQTFLLSAVYLGHFEVLEQLMPAVRLDGYYILGDLAGVPDLFGKIRPILRSMIPGRPTPPEVRDLKRSARAVVTVWVLAMVPLILGDLGYALWNLPRILTTGARSLTEQLAGTGSAFVHGQIAAGLVGVIGSLMLVCPLAGMAYLSVRLSGRLMRTLRRVSEGNTKLQVGISAAGAALVGGLCFAWVVGLTPKAPPPTAPLVPVLQPGVPTAVAAPAVRAVDRRDVDRVQSAVAERGAGRAPQRDGDAEEQCRRECGDHGNRGGATPGKSAPAASPSSSKAAGSPSASAAPTAGGTSPPPRPRRPPRRRTRRPFRPRPRRPAEPLPLGREMASIVVRIRTAVPCFAQKRPAHTGHAPDGPSRRAGHGGTRHGRRGRRHRAGRDGRRRLLVGRRRDRDREQLHLRAQQRR